MSVLRKSLMAAGALALMAAAVPANAQTAPRLSVGTLSCSVAPGISFVFGSTRQVNCIYYSADGMAERYIGEIDRWGVDIGYTNAATILWAVAAPTSKLPPGTLSGTYVGASAAATPGVGVGANVLLGGNNRTVSLQPVSVEGNTGLNIAAGVGALILRRAQ